MTFIPITEHLTMEPSFPLNDLGLSRCRVFAFKTLIFTHHKPLDFQRAAPLGFRACTWTMELWSVEPSVFRADHRTLVWPSDCRGPRSLQFYFSNFLLITVMYLLICCLSSLHTVFTPMEISLTCLIVRLLGMSAVKITLITQI